MTVKEIRESGLLELYVIGALEGSELATVEKALVDFPELREDIQSIEKSLQVYATGHSVSPSAALKEDLLNQIRKTSEGGGGGPAKDPAAPTGASRRSIYPLLAAALAALCLVLGYLWFDASQSLEATQRQFADLNQSCDSLQQENSRQIALFDALSDPDNEIIAVSPTPKFPETTLYFFHNDIADRNYIQLGRLPAIDNATQSFQLWSLKGTDPPIPLDVFQLEDEDYIEVGHVSGTNTYAITIEPKGGRQSPTLENLIGTFSIS